jgi:hypothetical protein
VEFLGNTALSDRTLSGALKSNKAQTLLSLFSDTGVFNVGHFKEDAVGLLGGTTNFIRPEVEAILTAR